MKKKSFAIVVIMTILLAGCGQEVVAKAQETVGLEKPLIKQRKTVKEDGSYTLADYDLNGYIYEERKYSKEGEFLSKRSCEYDEEYRLISDISLDADGVEKYGTEYVYDKKGRETQEYRIREGGTRQLASKTEYSRNEKTVEKTSYLSGDLWHISTTNLDDFGRILKETVHSEEGYVYKLTEYEYTEKGNLKEKTETAYGFKSVYEYDDEGRVVKESRYNPEGELTYYYLFYYCSFGETDRIACEADGNVASHKRIKYDDKGLVVSRVDVDDKGKEEETTRYEYDEMGNLLRKESCYDKYYAEYNEYGYPVMIHDICNNPARNAGTYDNLFLYEYIYY